MDSTNHNLENPTKIDTLRVVKDVESWNFPTVRQVTQEFYDLGQKHDPNVIYSITNSPDMRVYYGDILVLKSKSRSEKYFLTILDDGTYSISLNQVNNHHDNLIEICRFDDPQKAIESLALFNRLGTHQHKSIHLLNMINAYCNNRIGCHDFIIGIMTEFGYRNDPRLQEIIMAGNVACVNSPSWYMDSDIPDMLFGYLLGMKSTAPVNLLYTRYLDIYGIIVKYGFINMNEHMKEAVHDIMNVFS